MGRREMREHIFKLLFMAEFYQDAELRAQAGIYLDEMEREHFSEKEYNYVAGKFAKIQEELPKIDAILAEEASGWKLKRMNKVDLAILRLGAYETLMDEKIPVGVAINEAVELAKRFGGNESPAFVNGVLAKLARPKAQAT